ncbi:MAG: hypothetical protein IJ779_06440 [Ruminococcus sp.]|nr:hypothetical protein [Ruminococcus sp.]
MKNRFLAVLAAFTLIFSAGAPVYTTAHADNGYGDIIDAEIDGDGNINYDSEQGEILDSDYDYTESSNYTEDKNTAKTLGICILIGIAIGGIVTLSMVSSMKSVRRQYGAADYKKPNSFKLDVKQDNYLYNKIEKAPIPKQNNGQNG